MVYQMVEYTSGNFNYTVPTIFTSCTATNVQHAGFALLAGRPGSPPYIITNNVFGWNGVIQIGIALSGTPNVLICSNLIYGNGSLTPFSLSDSPLAQPVPWQTTNCANETAINNTVTGVSDYQYFYSTGTSQSSVDALVNSVISNNTIVGASYVSLESFGWTSNVTFVANECFGAKMGVGAGGGVGGMYAFTGTNNDYWQWILQDRDGSGNTSASNAATNAISYGGGSRYQLTYPIATNTVNFLSVSDSNQIPVGAAMYLTNATQNYSGPGPVIVYLDGPNYSGPSVTVPIGGNAVIYWSTNTWQWTTNSP